MFYLSEMDVKQNYYLFILTNEKRFSLNPMQKIVFFCLSFVFHTNIVLSFKKNVTFSCEKSSIVFKRKKKLENIFKWNTCES